MVPAHGDARSSPRRRHPRTPRPALTLQSRQSAGRSRGGEGLRGRTNHRPAGPRGPGDANEPLTYWPVRIEKGGLRSWPGKIPWRDRSRSSMSGTCGEWAGASVRPGPTAPTWRLGPQNGRSMAEFLYGIAAVTTAPLSWTLGPPEASCGAWNAPLRRVPGLAPHSGVSKASHARPDPGGGAGTSPSGRWRTRPTPPLSSIHSRPPETPRPFGWGPTAEQERGGPPGLATPAGGGERR